MQTENSQSMTQEEIPADLPRSSTRVVVMVAIVFVALLAALFVVGYIPYQREAAAISADAAERSSAVPSMAVLAPREQVSEKEIVVPADVRPLQETAVYPRTSGYLKKLYVDINDRVQAGQLLAEIDTPEVDAQLIQSKASLTQARANVVKEEADVAFTRKTLQRYRELPAAAVSAQDVDQKQSAYDDAMAALEQAKAAVAVAEADVQRLTILQAFEKVTAPFDGVVTARNYDVGALLAATGNSAREMFRITQSDTLRVNVNLPQVYASEVAIGEPAYLSVRNYPGREFTGVVTRCSGSLSSTSRTMLFELGFKNDQGLLYPGMYGQVRFVLSKQKPVLVIPSGAMLFGASGTQVATVEHDKVHFQDIKVGRDLGTEMEVVSGLTAQSRVIAHPAAQIAEGMVVHPIEQKVAENASTGTTPQRVADLHPVQGTGGRPQ